MQNNARTVTIQPSNRIAHSGHARQRLLTEDAQSSLSPSYGNLNLGQHPALLWNLKSVGGTNEFNYTYDFVHAAFHWAEGEARDSHLL